jgi:hypothetical protein
MKQISAYKFLVCKSGMEVSVGRFGPKCTWKNGVKIDVKGTGVAKCALDYLVEGRVQWRSCENVNGTSRSTQDDKFHE